MLLLLALSVDQIERLLLLLADLGLVLGGCWWLERELLGHVEGNARRAEAKKRAKSSLASTTFSHLKP